MFFRSCAARGVCASFYELGQGVPPKFVARSPAIPLRKFVLKILRLLTKIVEERCDVRQRYHSVNEYGDTLLSDIRASARDNDDKGAFAQAVG